MEIKSGLTLPSDMFDSLRWWTAISGGPLSCATLVYGGDQLQTRQDIAVRPWFAV